MHFVTVRLRPAEFDFDTHSENFPRLRTLLPAFDRALAGLIDRLQERDLLSSTAIMAAGEFGRTPDAQDGNGRDHNPHAFTMWMAGGGVKPGFSFGATDEWGYYAQENKVHMHDLHATILHIMGLDHELLTYFHQGRDESLTDVHGRVIGDILA